MSTFSSSFWSADYAAGLGVLFEKLQQGLAENEQVLTITRLRADAEDAYSQRLGDITPATERLSGGFQRDDGASVRKAYEGVRIEMDEAAKNHRKIASNIRELVVHPFGRWCEQHAARVNAAQDDLQQRVKLHDRQSETVRKLRSQYYNKCRLVEDLEEEDKLGFRDPEVASPASPKGKGKEVPVIKEPEPVEEEPELVDIGERLYTPEQVKQILTHILNIVKLGEQKVPILGTYQNVTSGSDLTDYIQKHMDATNIAAAEKIGQDLVNAGFLRLIGNVGSTFVNSSKMHYQWRPKSFEITGIPDKSKNLSRTGTLGSINLGSGDSDSPVNAVGEYLQGWNPLNNPYPNETPSEKLRREGRESDERYKAGVRKLDALRCNLEEAMIDRLKWMERCELDRLRAVKSVILDFSGAIGNVMPSLQSTVDKMMLFQETVQPIGDLRYLLENYRTGSYAPKVQVYENYYNNIDGQIFGVDLEARARADRKRVPLIITTLLTYLDDHYPDLDGDEARRSIWLVEVSLAKAHELRTQLNEGGTLDAEALSKFDMPVVANVLRLYLLELPDSIVASHVYDVVKTIYSNAEYTEDQRVRVILNALGHLRLANIASLDAITTHFTRLIELTSADEEYVANLASNLAPAIMRPRTETTLSMNERYAYRLVRDLFAHRDSIFGELKRLHSMKARDVSAPTANSPKSATNPARGRGLSTDERSRREAEQERHAAIASRSRATSPAPGNRNSIRRERSPNRMSIGGADTRFPIAVAGMGSPRETRARGATQSRNSLEVPSASAVAAALQDAVDTPPPVQEEEHSAAQAKKGVELTDAPMDD